MNNRQGGRRRGRGGQQARNGQPGNPHSNSRVDNRQRGNAAQLLEKYKALARDAQMVGDRVNTEYYLQFADHYFRVLSESRSRFEDQRRPRDDYGQEFGGDEEGEQPQRPQAGRDFADDGWDEEGDEAEAPIQSQPQRAAQPYREPPPQREPRVAEVRNERGSGDARSERGERGPGNRGDRRQLHLSHGNGEANERGSGGGQPAAEGNGAVIAPDFPPEAEVTRIELDRLPPALVGMAEPVMAMEGEPIDAAPKRRRGRKPKVATDAPPAEA